MKVAFITPEALPFSKTGGLADVSQALPAALARHGVDCTVFTPLHRQAAAWLDAHPMQCESVELPPGPAAGDGRAPLRYRVLPANRPQTVLVDNPHYFDRPHPYLDAHGEDHPDSVERFAWFCRSVLEYCRSFGPVPDVMHANDWQTALTPVYLSTLTPGDPLAGTRSLLTIHNIGYQGLFPPEQLRLTGLGWDMYTPECLEFYGRLNLLKGGITCSDAINTVSPTYAGEIQTPQYGKGLEGVLAWHSGKLTGILNGIDTEAWNPGADPHLPAAYSASDPAGKKVCRRMLQREMGLAPRPDCMLFGAISRLDRQKGIELLIEAFPAIARFDIQLIVLGSGDQALEKRLAHLAHRYPGQLALRLGYDEPLAHRIIAGVDAFIMPSRYEPCGLTQMYSHRYGTVPVVSETGGLRDTVVNYTPRRLSTGRAGGFTFRGDRPENLLAAVQAAARLFFTDRRSWQQLMQHIMSIDHSWPTSAAAYSALYRKLIQPARPGKGGSHD